MSDLTAGRSRRVRRQAREDNAVGARFFDCVRLDMAKARANVALKPHVRKAPCLLLVRPNGEVTRTLRKLSVAGVFGAMCANLRKDFENNLRGTVKAQEVCLKQRTKLTRARERLERLDGKDRAKAEQEVKHREAKLDTREAALYELEKRQ